MKKDRHFAVVGKVVGITKSTLDIQTDDLFRVQLRAFNDSVPLHYEGVDPASNFGVRVRVSFTGRYAEDDEPTFLVECAPDGNIDGDEAVVGDDCAVCEGEMYHTRYRSNGKYICTSCALAGLNAQIDNADVVSAKNNE
jgi:hypothetical protein